MIKEYIHMPTGIDLQTPTITGHYSDMTSRWLIISFHIFQVLLLSIKLEGVMIYKSVGKHWSNYVLPVEDGQGRLN